MTFHFMCVHIIFCSVSDAEWPLFSEIAVHSIDYMFSLYVDALKISYFPFWL